ncbi:hypothetical protein DFJ63DRAFT_336990 [Scheffersomyces coipomensis]|uniref:uncharacterized protein n=1 Tax=Scheffersomyces coipomensis TaxID=1788519 RepID=UPI00315CB214
MSLKDNSGHAYTSIPLEDVFSASDNDSNRLPSTPPPNFEEGTSFKHNHNNQTTVSDELAEIKRNIAEMNNTLAMLKASTGGFDPESLTATPNKPVECVCWKVVLGFVVVILFLMFFVWFAVYLNIWYERSTHNLS